MYILLSYRPEYFVFAILLKSLQHCSSLVFYIPEDIPQQIMNHRHI